MMIDDNDTSRLTIEAARLRLAKVDEPRDTSRGHGDRNYQNVLASLRLEAARREDATAAEWQAIADTLEEQIRQLLALAKQHGEIIAALTKSCDTRDEIIAGLSQINAALKAAIERHVKSVDVRC